jgi:hypothetical protein
VDEAIHDTNDGLIDRGRTWREAEEEPLTCASRRLGSLTGVGVQVGADVKSNPVPEASPVQLRKSLRIVPREFERMIVKAGGFGELA